MTMLPLLTGEEYLHGINFVSATGTVVSKGPERGFGVPFSNNHYPISNHRSDSVLLNDDIVNIKHHTSHDISSLGPRR